MLTSASAGSCLFRIPCCIGCNARGQNVPTPYCGRLAIRATISRSILLFASFQRGDEFTRNGRLFDILVGPRDERLPFHLCEIMLTEDYVFRVWQNPTNLAAGFQPV